MSEIYCYPQYRKCDIKKMYGYGRTIFGYGRTRAKVMDVHLGKSFRNHKKIDTKFKTHIHSETYNFIYSIFL